MLNDDERSERYKHICRLFSLFGFDSAVDVVGYVMYEFASRVTNYSFGFFIPILIATLGDKEFGGGRGKIIWGYTSAMCSITSVIMYLSCTPLMEFANWKRRALFGSCTIICVVHILFIFCFSGSAVILAVVLFIIAKTMQRVGDVAFEAFLDVISNKRDPHEISSRCNIMGYSGMLGFILFVVPIVAIVYFGATVHSTIWIEGIIPIVCVGLWYLNFTRYTFQMMSANIGIGQPLPSTCARDDILASSVLECESVLSSTLKTFAISHRV